MKLNYKAKNRSRINYGFLGFTSMSELEWWFNIDLNCWQYGYEYDHSQARSSHQECRSVRAFRRKLKKAPAAVKFTLSSRWRKMDVTGWGSNNRVVRTFNNI